MRRVVITGMGAITPVGLSVEEFWNSVKEGKTNFAEVTRFDSTNYRAHMAAEINNFNPKDYMDFKSAKRMELFSQYAVAAAKEAIEQSGLDMTKEDPFRVGCSVGSGIGSMQVVEKSCEILNTKGPGRLNPLMIPLLICGYFLNYMFPIVGSEWGLSETYIGYTYLLNGIFVLILGTPLTEFFSNRGWKHLGLAAAAFIYAAAFLEVAMLQNIPSLLIALALIAYQLFYRSEGCRTVWI